MALPFLPLCCQRPVRQSHLKAWHPEEDFAGTSLNKKALPLLNVAELAPEQRHWKCPLCDLGFSREQAATHPYTRRAHGGSRFDQPVDS